MTPAEKSIGALAIASTLSVINKRTPGAEELELRLQETAKQIQKERKASMFLAHAYAYGDKRTREAAGRVLHPEKHKAPKCKVCENDCPPGKVCCSAACWRAWNPK